MLLLSLLISHVLSAEQFALTDEGACNQDAGWVTDGWTKSCIKVVTDTAEKVLPKDALQKCKDLDSRAGLAVIQTDSKLSTIQTAINDGEAGAKYLTGGVAVKDPLTVGGLPVGWVMADGTTDLLGVHEKAYTDFSDAADPQTTYGTDATTDWNSVVTEHGLDGVVIITQGQAKPLDMVFNGGTITYNFVCEVCKSDTNYGTCGSIAQIIEKKGEDLPNSVPASCPTGKELTSIDTLVCEDCKCWGASQKTKLIKTGADKDVPYSRKECKDAATVAGFPYFSYMPLGFRSACVFGKDFSSEMACTNLRIQGVDVDRKWSIFETKKECIQKCTAEAKNILAGYKCKNTENIRFHKQKVRMLSIDDCAQAAYNHGRKYFSFNKLKRWCYFGRDKSGDDECNTGHDGGAIKATKTPEKLMKDGAEIDNELAQAWVVAEAGCKVPEDQWVIGEDRATCTSTCVNANLECDATKFVAQLSAVDSSVELQAVIFAAADAALKESLTATPLETCDPSSSGPVPVFNTDNRKCFYSQSPRDTTTICEAVPTGGQPKHRVCYCTKTAAQEAEIAAAASTP